MGDMADGIELTTDQIDALARIAAEHGNVLVRQLSGEGLHTTADVYVTVMGTSHGHRVTPSGQITDIGETQPA